MESLVDSPVKEKELLGGELSPLFRGADDRKQRKTRLGNLLGRLRDRRERVSESVAAWSPVQSKPGTVPAWQGESSKINGESAAIQSKYLYSDVVQDYVKRSISEETKEGREERSKQQPLNFQSPQESRPRSSSRDAPAEASGIVSHPNAIGPLPQSTNISSAGKVSLDTSLTPRRKRLPNTEGSSATKRQAKLGFEDASPRKIGFRVPNLDSSSDEEESGNVEDESFAESEDFPIIVAGGMRPESSVAYDVMRNVWLDQETQHGNRVSQFVGKLRENRTKVESELDQQLMEIQNYCAEKKDRSMHECVRPEKDKALLFVEMWRKKRRAQAEKCLRSIKATYSERLQKNALENQKLEKLRREKEEEERAKVAREEAAQKRKEEEARRKLKELEEQKKKQEKASKLLAEQRKVKERVDGEYMELRKMLERLNEKSERFKNDRAFSKARLQLKKIVNLNINQIAASQRQVQRVSMALKSALDQASANGEDAVAFTEDLIGERLVGEGKGQVMLHSHSAFPIAAVAVFLTGSYPQLAPILLAHFQKVCPYTAPYFPHRLKGQSEEEYRKTLGYLDGETTDQYYERMCGYLSLYSAILQTDLRNSLGIKNPLGISRGWTWLAKIVNAKPRRITATLIITFLEMCAFEMHRNYGKQFVKLLDLIASDLIPALPKDSPPGPTTRIVVFIEECYQGQLRAPKGRDLPARDFEMQ